MNRIACAALLLVACQGGDERSRAPAPSPSPSPSPTVSAAYKSDIDKLCNVVERAGATGLAEYDKIYVTSQWLPQNLETEDSRKFLIRIQPLQGAPKADALDAEAKRVGLASCPLAADWRKL